MGLTSASHDYSSPRNRPSVKTGTYAHWRTWLDQFASGVDVPAPERRLGEGDGAVTIFRFGAHCAEALNDRFKLWKLSFERDIVRINGSRSVDVEQQLRVCLATARRNLSPLVQFVNQPAFPTRIGQDLQTNFAEALNSAQQHLEDNARKEGPAADWRLRIHRELPLTGALQRTEFANPTGAGELSVLPKRRKIFL
jgi:hypothetical protein